MCLGNKKGFTLLEMVMALGLTAVLAALTLSFFPGSIAIFTTLANAERNRLEVLSPLEALGNEAALMRSIYRDPAQCYEVCMADTNGDRVYYFWKDDHLYRKAEAAAGHAVDCSTGGQHFSGPMDTANSSFGMQRDLLTVRLAASASGSTYDLTGVFMPLIRERMTPFYEGFECNTLAQGWTKTNGAHSNWSIVSAVQGFGNYEIAHTMTAAGTDTATIEIPVDLARFSKAVITFNYRNSGTLSAGDGFYLDWWDGTTWQNAFDDVSLNALASSTPIQADVTDYNLTTSSKFRIRSILSSASARWYVDNLTIFAP